MAYLPLNLSGANKFFIEKELNKRTKNLGYVLFGVLLVVLFLDPKTIWFFGLLGQSYNWLKIDVGGVNPFVWSYSYTLGALFAFGLIWVAKQLRFSVVQEKRVSLYFRKKLFAQAFYYGLIKYPAFLGLVSLSMLWLNFAASGQLNGLHWPVFDWRFFVVPNIIGLFVYSPCENWVLVPDVSSATLKSLAAGSRQES